LLEAVRAGASLREAAATYCLTAERVRQVLLAQVPGGVGALRPLLLGRRVRRWTDAEVALLGKRTDREVAARLGLCMTTVLRKRLGLGITACGRAWPDLTKVEYPGLKALRLAPRETWRGGHREYVCECRRCGRTVQLPANNIPKVKSCGCLRAAMSAAGGPGRHEGGYNG
jgi:hypothetical protein